MTTLKEAVTKVPEYQNCSERIEFFEGPIQDLTEKYQFDIIICALPFLNFGKELTESILAKINRLAAKNSVMTHFEYIALGHLGSAFSKKRKEQFQELRTIFNVSKSTSNISRKKVWRNLFPIYVYTTALPLKFESSISDSAANTVLSH
jgi:phospholipid N-methyltransferase